MLEKGAKVRAYDPAGMDEFKKAVTGRNLSFCQDAYQAAKGADALVFLTEWNELRNLDLKKLLKIIAQPLILDLRNIYDSGKMRELGYTYIGVGRGM
ncbi:MAG: UDP-glucose/GDP-mannose dehydrogenase family protein [Deltaproteobacteria bacterium]|nr:UDP-glucose/GDP-mannose dehydrogenase family protein [Deltaproteobacteria bacterium]